jgi:hypothetical protein
MVLTHQELEAWYGKSASHNHLYAKAVDGCPIHPPDLQSLETKRAGGNSFLGA